MGAEAKGCHLETLIVDAEGKIIIPPAVLQKRGLQPGDAVALVEAAEGLLVYQGGIDPKTLAWWQTLSDEERRLGEAGRLLVRYSGTEPKARIMVEGESLPLVEETAARLKAIIHEEIGQEP